MHAPELAPPVSGSYVGRLAPSPTGLLHLGHAWTFLIAWWCARERGGSLLLRFEDLDQERSQTAFVQQALDDLAWLGIDWDGPPSFQSNHLPRIHAAARALEQGGRAYACTCSRGDIRALLSAPHAGDDREYYPGTCRGRFASMAEATAETGKPAGLRFLSPDEAFIFEDELMGQVSENVAQTASDFLILRRCRTPAYQLAVVVDDHAQGVTHVVRGQDLLDSTPRQLALQKALGWPHPRYTHVPLVVDETGRRLAKRADALSLAQLRAAGVQPEAIVSWVAEKIGVELDGRASARAVLPKFSLQPLRTLGPRPVVADAALIRTWQQN
jgi:glutamyl-tRNA synthetase